MYAIHCTFTRYNNINVDTDDIMDDNITVYKNLLTGNNDFIVDVTYEYLYEAHIKHTPLTKDFYKSSDVNTIPDYSKMILFPNIITTEEVFSRRAEQMNVDHLYVELAVDDYKNKLPIDQV